MIVLYHGSYTEVSVPDLTHSRTNIDFGAGFYVTPLYDQAVRWAQRFKKRNGLAVVSYYTFEESSLDDLKVLKFDSYSEDWLDFIISCRQGTDISDYDVVIGGVANDKVFNTIELFFDGLIDKDVALSRLKFEQPNLQMCFRTEEALKKLNFEGSEIK
jgi:hypothetical protein